MMAMRMEPTVRTGGRQAYSAAVTDLWERVGTALTRLERIAETPTDVLVEEHSDELPGLQYSLHAGAELAVGIEPPPAAEDLHEELVAALAEARDATAEVAYAMEIDEVDGVEPLLPEWRGSLFRVRLARLRALERTNALAAEAPPAPPEQRKPEHEGASEDEYCCDDRRPRRALVVGLAPLGLLRRSLGCECIRPLERAQAGEPDAEERTAPLGQERLDAVGLVDLDGVGDLGRRVTRLGEGGHKLLVQVLRGRRRFDADGELGARVQRVLEARKLVRVLFHEHVGRALGDALEAGQCRPDALPEIRDCRRIRLPSAGPNGWFHAPRNYTPFARPGRAEGAGGAAGSGPGGSEPVAALRPSSP